MSKLSYKADIMIVLNHILYLRLWFDSVLAWIYFKNVIVLNQIPQVFELILIAFSFPVAVFVKQEGIYRTVNEPLHSASALTFFLSFFLSFFIYLFILPLSASNLLGRMKGVCSCKLLFCFILVLFILIHYICFRLFW